MMISRRVGKKEIQREDRVVLIYGKELNKREMILHPSNRPLIEEYSDVFPRELPKGLPSLRGIEHQIELVLGAALPSRSTYRVNP